MKKNLQLIRNMGFRYIAYRISFEIGRKAGMLKIKHPTSIKFKNKIELEDWRKIESPTEFKMFEHKNSENCLKTLKEKGERILNGEVCFFSNDWAFLGDSFDWVTNPSNDFKYDVEKHWSEIPDLSKEAGDIKYVWEKSRFSWLLTLIRYDYHFKEDLSEFVFSEITSWIQNNPINRGPNWRCSQEISLRIFNWYIALVYYKHSPALTSIRWMQIQDVIFASLHHVYKNINFSRIAVRNNHAITETLFLSLSEILFPFIPETKEWSIKGRKWFEEEIAYQIYDDGTFLQFSMNYHRVVVQLLTLGISITERVGKTFSKVVYDRAYKSLDFLYQCAQEENGWLPNYGSNDGALFFPWSDTDYRDYRPQLNSLHTLLTGQSLYSDDVFSEELFWWNIDKDRSRKLKVLDKFYGIKEYPNGGYVIIRDSNTFTFLRCGSHKDRPAQADNLHIDIWVEGKNILRDSGTYKYNTSIENLNYFMGTTSHNAVVVDGKSQMLKGGRFIWYYWTQKEYCSIAETSNEFIVKGEIKAYQFLNKDARVVRSVKKLKDEKSWIVTDEVVGLVGLKKEQIWHLNGGQIEIIATEDNLELAKNKIISYNSDYYGIKENGEGISFSFDKKIETKLIVK